MTRRRLPDRRPSATQAIRWAGSDDQATTYTVTVGFHLDGTPAEVFADGPKTGSAMQALLADACVVVSLALQHGIAPADLARSMARVPVSEIETRPASVIGAVVEVLAEGQAVAELSRCRDSAESCRKKAESFQDAETTPPSPPATRRARGAAP